MSYPMEAGVGTAGVNVIDLRSDTVTRPDATLRRVMAEAVVGDDVYGDDPSVTALERAMADVIGTEAALFLPSGTQSNLAALLAHCGRGHEALVGRSYHIYSAEAAGASVLGGIALEPLAELPCGGIAPDTISRAVKPDDSHCPVTRLLCLENTTGGRAVPLATQQAALDAARAAGLVTHLDGARIFNAAQALGVTPARVAAGFDSVSVCLSKGLGAPAGSVLCGPAAFIRAARRWRKMLGGGMRQSGILAAAGHHVLTHHVADLAQDHARAEWLRSGLAQIDGLDVETAPGQTNMVWLRFAGLGAQDLAQAMLGQGVLIGPGEGSLRIVVHRDIDDAAISQTLAGFRAVFAA